MTSAVSLGVERHCAMSARFSLRQEAQEGELRGFDAGREKRSRHCARPRQDIHFIAGGDHFLDQNLTWIAEPRHAGVVAETDVVAVGQ